VTEPVATKKEKVPQVTLSLRLLRDGFSPGGALRDGHKLEQVASSVGPLFVGQSHDSPPSWVKFLATVSPDGIGHLRTKSCAAVLFVTALEGANERTFAICFGQGHHALDDDAIERGFGLRVVLNSVARGSLRTLDSASLDATVMQRRVQSSRDTDLSAFDLDANRDLLRLASGTPDSSGFAAALSGKDALMARTKVTANDLETVCRRALAAYQLTDYKKDFGFIDHIRPVTDSKLWDTLDKDTFLALKASVAGQFSDLHLAIPDVLSPGSAVEVGYFGLGLKSGAKATYSEIAIEDYVQELALGFGEIKDMAALRSSHEIRVVEDGAGDKSHRRKVYSCFVFEITKGGASYVLFDGQWFLVDAAYFSEVEADYQAALKPSFLPSTPAKTERDLIANLIILPNLLCMDQVRIAPRGAGNAMIEPCDFLSTTKQLIHLKDGHGSAPLSHLWNQAVVSTEAMVRDDTFRKAMRREARKRERQYGKKGQFVNLLPDRVKLNPSDYTIVLGVMRHPYKASKQVGLPFFSKVAMRGPIQRMTMLGFNVELHLIEKT
jgi:uncharacterized protein (TIGR04141 family)